MELELKDRLGVTEDLPVLPQVFIDGEHIGSCEQIEQMNETGQLRKILRHFKKCDPKAENCATCGGFNYVPCPKCCGTSKNYVRHVKTADYVKLKCTACDASGLVKCPKCSLIGQNEMNHGSNSTIHEAFEEGLKI